MNTMLPQKSVGFSASVGEDLLAYLLEIWRDGVDTTEARSRLKTLQNRYQPLRFELIWDREFYGDTVQYSVLLYLPEGGTATISLSPDRPLPWLLRWASHAREEDVVRVNGMTLKVRDMMACAESLWEQAAVSRQLVNLALTSGAIEEYEIHPTPTDLQQAMNSFRRQHGLLTAQSTHEWLEDRGMTQAKLESLLEYEAATTALRNLIADDSKIQRYWQQNIGAFDTVYLASFEVNDREQAREIYTAISEGKTNFYEAAEAQFSMDNRLANREDLFTQVKRSALPSQEAEVIFAATPGQVIEPIERKDRLAIVKVLKQHIADLSEPSTYEAVKLAVFNEWLNARRQQAKVEWLWGRISDD